MALGIRSTAQELIERPIEGGIHQRPRGTQHAFFADALWIVIQPKKIKTLSALNRGGQELGEDHIDTFKFLAPNEIQENIGHEWNEYESIASRVAQKVADLSKTAKETKGLVRDVAASNNKGDIMGTAMAAVANVMRGQTIYQRKIDAALTYTNSPRRQYTFPFTLVDEGNPNIDIIDPINRLKMYSCSERQGLVNFSLPYIFEVYSEPNNFLHVKNAVITAIQPTFKGPYRNGFPSVADLELTFMDLDPLYRDTFEKVEKVTISDTLMRHIPHYDKFKRFSSYNKRIQDQHAQYKIDQANAFYEA
jgi:hypothetical protein